jgi:hypothetical protein
MILIGQITPHTTSPVVQAALVAAGCLVLYVAFKIGGVILKMLLGLALIAGAVWWFHSR